MFVVGCLLRGPCFACFSTWHACCAVVVVILRSLFVVVRCVLLVAFNVLCCVRCSLL